MGMLCNVTDRSNIDNDTIQFINNVNDPYILLLLPDILVCKVQNHDHVLVQPDAYPHQNLALN